MGSASISQLIQLTAPPPHQSSHHPSHHPSTHHHRPTIYPTPYHLSSTPITNTPHHQPTLFSSSHPLDSIQVYRNNGSNLSVVPGKDLFAAVSDIMRSLYKPVFFNTWHIHGNKLNCRCKSGLLATCIMAVDMVLNGTDSEECTGSEESTCTWADWFQKSVIYLRLFYGHSYSVPATHLSCRHFYRVL